MQQVETVVFHGVVALNQSQRTILDNESNAELLKIWSSLAVDKNWLEGGLAAVKYC